jgi:hypothetical protein
LQHLAADRIRTLEAPLGDSQLNDITEWLLKQLRKEPDKTPDDLIQAAEGQFSPSDVTWAIWYLKSAGRIRLTKDDMIGAA